MNPYEIEIRFLSSVVNATDFSNKDLLNALLKLDVNDFSEQATREIFALVKKNYQEKQPFDAISLLSYQSRLNAEAYQILSQAITQYAGLNTVNHDVEVLTQASIKRKLRRKLSNIEQELEDVDNPHMFGATLSKEIAAIAMNKVYSEKTAASIVEEAIARGEIEPRRIKTHIQAIDDATLGGFTEGSLVTICGGSGVGKSFIAAYMAVMIGNMEEDTQSVFFNFEMGEQELAYRIASMYACKHSRNFNDEDKAYVVNAMKKHKIVMCDHTDSDIELIELRAKTLASEKPIKAIYVDYLNLIQAKGKYERNDLRIIEVCRRLAQLAIDLNTIVVLMTQTNRSKENRNLDDRVPDIKDASDSMGSVRSSSYWFGIDRPEIYDDSEEAKNMFIMACRKNRNWNTFTAYFNFNGGLITQCDQRAAHEKEQRRKSNCKQEFKL